MEVVIPMPTSPRRENGTPTGFLTKSIHSLAATIETEASVNARVLIMDCSPPGDHHEELDALLSNPPPNLKLESFPRKGPFFDLKQIEILASPERIQRDGLEVTRWTYQQSADFLELMARAAVLPRIDWLVRVEDDALFSQRWVARMARGAARHPKCPLFSLFGIRLRFDGQSTTHHTGAVALAFRPGHLTRVLAAVKDSLGELPFDVALGNLGGKVLYPSLVQHIGRIRSNELGHPSGMWISPTFRHSDHPFWKAAWQCRIAWLLGCEGLRRVSRRVMQGDDQ